MRAPAIALPTPIPAAAPGAIECLDGCVIEKLELAEFVLDEFVVGLDALNVGVGDESEFVVELIDGDVDGDVDDNVDDNVDDDVDDNVDDDVDDNVDDDDDSVVEVALEGMIVCSSDVIEVKVE